MKHKRPALNQADDHNNYMGHISHLLALPSQIRRKEESYLTPAPTSRQVGSFPNDLSDAGKRIRRRWACGLVKRLVKHILEGDPGTSEDLWRIIHL